MPTPETLPVYWATLDDDAHGLSFVSLVDKPAIERNFVALAAAKRANVCAVANEEKRLVYGPILRADFPIYRNDSERGEYYIAFSADCIRKAVEKFLADKQAGNVNVMHEAGSQVDGVHLVQLFIKNTAAGIAPAGFDDIEEGSLFGEYHVTDDDIWAAIKAGEFRGFSIEGNFSFSTQKSQFQQTNTAMSKLQKLKAQLAAMLVQLGAATTDKGALFWEGDEDLKAGMPRTSKTRRASVSPRPTATTRPKTGKPLRLSMARSPRSSTRKPKWAPKAKAARATREAARTRPASTRSRSGWARSRRRLPRLSRRSARRTPRCGR